MKRTWIAGLLLFALVLSGLGAGYASAAESQGTDSNILIAYFSRVGNTDFPDDIDAVTSASLLKDGDKLYGNTQYVAAMIQQRTGGDLFLIETEEKYPSVYEQIDEQGGEEHRSGVRPKLASHVDSMDDYSVIFLGYPIWYYDLPMAVYSFLEEYDLSGKTIIPFVTSGASGFMGTIIDGLRRKFMVERPVKRIIAAAEKIMAGDFSVKIKPFHSIDSMDGFDVIIGYINRMTEELSSIETLRTDFISNVSHELKTPLAIIQNYGTMLQQLGLSEKQRQEYAKAITDAYRRLADLITNILKLNKLENQQIYPEKETFNLGEQLCECLLAFEDVWEEKGIEIDTDIAEEIKIKSDRALLSLVWNNLFSNALKFTLPEGYVSISLKLDGKFAVVQISDSGCGISPEMGAHIFEKFYQGDTSHSTQGNGLGLALVKRVIDIVDGDISVSSEVGKGSIFTVIIRSTEDDAV